MDSSKHLKQVSSMESYLQHEDGYSLTPEYRDAKKQVDYAEMEVEHWKQQLPLKWLKKPLP